MMGSSGAGGAAADNDDFDTTHCGRLLWIHEIASERQRIILRFGE